MSLYGFDRLREQLEEHIDSEWEWQVEEVAGTTKIEQLLLFAILTVCNYGGSEHKEVVVALTEEHEVKLLGLDNFNGIEPGLTLIVRPQAKMKGRVVDFLIHALDIHTNQWRQLVVECDGHDFHERTKEQAARDRAKDRALTLKGKDNFRFTGSEIWRDPWDCARQIFDWAVGSW